MTDSTQRGEETRDRAPRSRFATGAQRTASGDRPAGDRPGGDRGERSGGDRPGSDRGDRPGGDRGPRGGGRGGFGGRGRGRKEPIYRNDEVVDYKDVQRLRRALDERGKISNRRKTNCSAGQQRALTVAIKRARHMALLPFVSDGRR